MGLKDILYFCMQNLALCFKLVAPYEPNHKAGYHIMVLVTCETCSLRVLLARLKVFSYIHATCLEIACFKKCNKTMTENNNLITKS